MKLLRLTLAGILLVAFVGGVAPSVTPAAAPTPPMIGGRDRAVYLSFSGEGLNEGARAVALARLQQEVQVLERIFLAMHARGQLDRRYQFLVIRAEYREDAVRGVDLHAAVLTRAPAATLLSDRTTSLGPAYLIDTSLFSFDDLLALVLLLPGLDRQSPILTVPDAVFLAQLKPAQNSRLLRIPIWSLVRPASLMARLAI